MITNKIELTNEVIEANKDLIFGIIELMNVNHDIVIEDVQDIVIYEEGNDILNIEVEGFEFVASDNYTSLEELATERNIEILEDCGIPENLLFEAELQGWIDEEYFRNYWHDIHYLMAYEEGIQYIASEEELEALDAGLTTEEDIREYYYNSLQASIEGNELQEYKYQYGEEEFQRVLIERNLIDITALAKWCVDMDGVAHTLATYDGEEDEFNGFYFFRTN